MNHPQARFYALVTADGATVPLASMTEIQFMPNSTHKFTQTDLKTWNRSAVDWFFQIIGEKEVHVGRSGNGYSVTVKGFDIKEVSCHYYDTFTEAIVLGQVEVDTIKALAEHVQAVD